ncbi:substrate-binding periplasmic protein [Alteromonas gracilis]|uniref:substrate-binding periplasmic protein n=1 Tax=Alteromonas gracilis TaxID=1479524 RepID=UPI00373701FD
MSLLKCLLKMLGPAACFTSLFCFAYAQGKVSSIRFAVNTPGSPPYLYFDTDSQAYQGVVVDFFASQKLSSQFSVKYLDSNRARSESLLESRAVDVFLSSERWIDTPNDFLISDVLMQHNSYMYATSNFNSPFIPAENFATSICTRYGFTYPVLQRFFDDDKRYITRVNSSSQFTMAMMLSKGRCDFAIMNEYNARSVMFDEKFCSTTFYQSPNVISGVNLVFIIRSGLDSLKHEIDTALKHFVESGERQRSIERHSGVNQFPKVEC